MAKKKVLPLYWSERPTIYLPSSFPETFLTMSSYNIFHVFSGLLQLSTQIRWVPNAVFTGPAKTKVEKTKVTPTHVALFTGRDPARGSGQNVFKNSRTKSGRARRYSQSHGSGRVGSGRVESGGCSSITNRCGRAELIRPVRSPDNNKAYSKAYYIVHPLTTRTRMFSLLNYFSCSRWETRML